MKKTEFTKPEYSVAMSQDTGCIVMVEKRGDKVKVMGSLTHEDSLKFANDVLKWMPEALRGHRVAEPILEAFPPPPKPATVN